MSGLVGDSDISGCELSDQVEDLSPNQSTNNQKPVSFDIEHTPVNISEVTSDSPSIRKCVIDRVANIQNTIVQANTLIKLIQDAINSSNAFTKALRAVYTELDSTRKSIQVKGFEVEGLNSKTEDYFLNCGHDMEIRRSNLFQITGKRSISLLQNLICKARSVKRNFRKWSLMCSRTDALVAKICQLKRNSSRLHSLSKELVICNQDRTTMFYETATMYNEYYAYMTLTYFEAILDLTGIQEGLANRVEELTENALRAKSARRFIKMHFELLSSSFRTLNEEKSNLLAKKPSQNVLGRISMQGYLFLKCNSNVFKRKFFVLKDSFFFCHKTADTEKSKFVLNMLLCSVRPAPHQNRNFCFKLIAPQKTLTLQAESEALMNEWVEKLKTCISAQLKGMSMNRNNPLTNATKESDARNLLNPDFLELGSSLEKVYRYSERDRANCLEMIKNLFISDPSNEQCVDCGDKLPTWVSINLGALMCLECSGIHRALGTHISRVKSIVLDELEFSTILLIGSIGNSNLNSIYDPQGLLVLKPDSSRKQREAVIKAKYEQRIMVPKYGNKDLEADGKEYVDVSSEHIDETASLQAELAHTIKSGNVLDVLRLYAQGADLNYCYHDDFSKYPIHYAVNVGSIEVLEFLIQNGANMNVQDDYKKTPLHYAVVENSLCAAFLCKHKANIDLLDADNNMPIDIALKFQNANSLTLLRLIRLARECEREESKQFLAELDVFIMDTYNRELSQQQGSGSVEQAEGLAT